MSDTEMTKVGRQWRKNRGSKISITDLPSEEDMQEAAKGDDAAGTRQDRFPLHTPEQIEQETRTVRLDITFEDVVKIRDQCEMIMEGCRIIMEKTREHKLGSTRQRIGARQEAASLGRALARFNGKTPYGDSRRKPRSY
jgi:hypothetical protein